MINNQDIIILLLLSIEGKPIMQKDIAFRSGISPAAISVAMKRLIELNLLSEDRWHVMQHNFLDFLSFGLPYVFPAKLGAITKGVPTYISAEPLKQYFNFDQSYVWPSVYGEAIGQSIKPIYPTIPKIINKEPKLYQSLTLIDALRVGQVREKKKAISLLKKLLDI